MAANQSISLHTEEQEQSSLQAIPIEDNKQSKPNWLKVSIFFIVIIFINITIIFFNVEWQKKQSQLDKKQKSQYKNNSPAVQQANKKIQNQIKSLKNQLKLQESKISLIEKQLKYGQKTIKQEQGKDIVSAQAIKMTKEISKNCNAVKFEYTPNKQVLPIDPSLKNSQNKHVVDALYKDQKIRKQRGQFVQQRIDFTNSRIYFQGITLIKYNLVANEQMQKQAISYNEQQWVRLQNKFKISSVKKELPMCVVATGHNNNANFRIQANLNSVFTQNYTNYKYVIINDASTDRSNEIFRNYFNFYKIDQSKFVYIENKKRVTALQNYYNSAINQCSKDSIVMMIDGDDEYIGRNILKLFNWGYQTKNVGVLYSNFYQYGQGFKVKPGFTQEYTEDEKKNNLYRDVPMKFSCLRSARAELFHRINPQSLKQNGDFFKVGYDIALFFPLMELSCGRVAKIEGEFNYAYTTDTGQNDYSANKDEAIKHGPLIRKLKKYDCWKQFDQRMGK